MRKDKFEAILFDMDGVLIDSRPAMEIAWEHATTMAGLDIPFIQYLNYVGLPFNDILQRLLIDKVHWSLLSVEYRNSASENLSKIVLYKNVLYVLSMLRTHGFQVGVVTSKEFLRADIISDSFRLPLDVLITPELTELGKPAPDPLFRAAQTLNICDLGNILYVGDMNSDYLCARNAGASFIFAEWGYGNISTSVSRASSMLDILEYLCV